DENIPFARVAELVGAELAARVRAASLALYRDAADYAAARGVLVADTKFEFGVDAHGELLLIDELLTPDSSRFWPADAYRPGGSPPSFDKQFVRDHVAAQQWDRTPPGPRLPQEVIEATAQRYQQAWQ